MLILVKLLPVALLYAVFGKMLGYTRFEWAETCGLMCRLDGIGVTSENPMFSPIYQRLFCYDKCWLCPSSGPTDPPPL